MHCKHFPMQAYMAVLSKWIQNVICDYCLVYYLTDHSSLLSLLVYFQWRNLVPVLFLVLELLIGTVWERILSTRVLAFLLHSHQKFYSFPDLLPSLFSEVFLYITNTIRLSTQSAFYTETVRFFYTLPIQLGCLHNLHFIQRLLNFINILFLYAFLCYTFQWVLQM